MVLYFIATVFLSATLLFSVQPMVAKTLLPVFGGSSSVWTTCMLFYQTVLLLGYLYAHFVMKRVPRKVQLVGHVGMLIIALAAGILFDTPVPPPEATTFPVPWLILQLALVSGLPFFMISSAGPLVQGWFARTGHSRAHDPYFLYAASNLGSLIGLLAYPFVVEPLLGLDTQRMVWLSGFGVFIVLSAGAIWMTREGSGKSDTGTQDLPKSNVPEAKSEAEPAEQIDWPRRFRWMFYAFVPSTMLLGVTSHISMDIASFPLLWVLPLAVYLLTMIIAFAVNPLKLVDSMRRPMVVSVIGAALLVSTSAQINATVEAVVLVQIILLATVGLFGHGLLSADRPHAEHLTEFYLIMSIGGALGGFFNGVVAPLVFETTSEYQIALLCAVALLPWKDIRGIDDPKKCRKARLFRYGLPIAMIGYIVFLGFFGSPILAIAGVKSSLSIILFVLIVIIPTLLAYIAWKDGLACVLMLAVPLGFTAIESRFDPHVQMRVRTFYGVMSVVDKDYYDPYIEDWVVIRTLLHGTTDHGIEYIGKTKPAQPQGYYNRRSPCGMALSAAHLLNPDGMNLGVVGLGAGGIAAYNRPNDSMTYFEIDPEIATIANDRKYFSYLSDAKGQVKVKLGDGRLLLENERSASEPEYDMLVIDAFSSDSIPVHLLTEEAVELYFDRITDDGVVLIHISNRHMDLHPLIFKLGKAHGATVMIRDQGIAEIEEGREPYWFASTWMALSKNPDAVMTLYEQGLQVMEKPKFDVRIWTDQYSNILSLFN